MLVFYTWTVRNVADAISLMSSTEKVGWLATKTPQEGDALYTADHGSNASGGKDAEGGKMVVSVDAGSDGGAPAGWPRQGTIEFQNVWMKYLPSAPYALKGESLLLLVGCWVAVLVLHLCLVATLPQPCSLRGPAASSMDFQSSTHPTAVLCCSPVHTACTRCSTSSLQQSVARYNEQILQIFSCNLAHNCYTACPLPPVFCCSLQVLPSA
jgi:hypothetical protein